MSDYRDEYRREWNAEANQARKKTFDEIVNQAWEDLVEKDDRTSPEEYPEMALITVEELREFMERARQALP